MDDKELSFTNVDHIARKKLFLSTNEYCIADAVYHLSNNPDGNGWCYASKGWLASRIGLSEQSIHSILKKLLEKGIIEKHSQTKHLKTTKLWYETVILPIQSSNFSPTKGTLVEPLKKLDPTTKETLPNIYNYIHKHKIKDTNVSFVPRKKENQDITDLLDYLQKQLGLPALDGSYEKNRYLANNTIRKIRKAYPNDDPISVIKHAIRSAAHDDFHRMKCTSFYYIYNNLMKLVPDFKAVDSKHSSALEMMRHA